VVVHGEVAVEGQQVQQLLEQVALGRGVQHAAASLRECSSGDTTVGFRVRGELDIKE
jgi:hypothetical protein